MKYTILLLSLLTITSNLLLAEDVNLSNRLCCPPKEKHKKERTCAPTPISHPITITKSGCYCLTRDIVGTIVIATDNVMLDLNCHLVDGNGAEFAISTSNQHDVTIQNGAVTNAGSICISVINSEGVTIDTIQAYNTESAIQLLHCSSSCVSNIRVYDCLSTFSALLLIDDNSDSIEISDVMVQRNTKNASGTTNEFTPGTAFVAVNNSTNVTFTRVNVNTNTFNNSTPIADQAAHWRTAEAIAFIQSQNCTLTDCSTSNNTDVAGNLATLDTEDYMLLFRACSGCVVTGHQANANACTQPIAYFSVVASLDSSNMIFNASTLNNNRIDILPILPFAAFAPLFWVTPYFGDHQVNDTIISHCQISGNVVVDGGSGRTSSEGDLICMYVSGFSNVSGLENRTRIEHCQITDNSMTSTQPIQFVEGILVEQASDVSISNCICNGNSGGSLLLSIVLEGGIGNPCRNATINNSTANNNSNQTLAFGITLFGDFDPVSGLRGACENCTIINCQANGNTATQNSCGIAFSGTTECSAINCQADANSRSGIYAGVVYAPGDAHPLNQDNSIINCSAKNNLVNGFELSITGSNDNFLIEESVALANTGVGFLHENTTLTTRYFGNYAKGNGTDYSINGGAIQLFSLDVNGTYTHVTGDPNHFSALVNVEGI